jgi:hypothetical protein
LYKFLADRISGIQRYASLSWAMWDEVRPI